MANAPAIPKSFFPSILGSFGNPAPAPLQLADNDDIPGSVEELRARDDSRRRADAHAYYQQAKHLADEGGCVRLDSFREIVDMWMVNDDSLERLASWGMNDGIDKGKISDLLALNKKNCGAAKARYIADKKVQDFHDSSAALEKMMNPERFLVRGREDGWDRNDERYCLLKTYSIYRPRISRLNQPLNKENWDDWSVIRNASEAKIIREQDVPDLQEKLGRAIARKLMDYVRAGDANPVSAENLDLLNAGRDAGHLQQPELNQALRSSYKIWSDRILQQPRETLDNTARDFRARDPKRMDARILKAAVQTGVVERNVVTSGLTKGKFLADIKNIFKGWEIWFPFAIVHSIGYAIWYPFWRATL